MGCQSCSKTDPDATFMALKDGQLLPASNIIEGSENQLIVNYTIHQTSSETNEFVAHIDSYGFSKLLNIFFVIFFN